MAPLRHRARPARLAHSHEPVPMRGPSHARKRLNVPVSCGNCNSLRAEGRTNASRFAYTFWTGARAPRPEMQGLRFSRRSMSPSNLRLVASRPVQYALPVQTATVLDLVLVSSAPGAAKLP